MLSFATHDSVEKPLQHLSPTNVKYTDLPAALLFQELNRPVACNARSSDAQCEKRRLPE
jgi:hypothetical protein